MKSPTPAASLPVAKKPKEGMTRKAFGELFKRLLRPDAPKPPPKQP